MVFQRVLRIGVAAYRRVVITAGLLRLPSFAKALRLRSVRCKNALPRRLLVKKRGFIKTLKGINQVLAELGSYEQGLSVKEAEEYCQDMV